jgi:hypothetical protein
MGPVTGFIAAGSGTWQNSIGSNLTFDGFVDPANGQGAAGGAGPGKLVDRFSGPAGTSIIQSFSNGTDTGAFAAGGHSR